MAPTWRGRCPNISSSITTETDRVPSARCRLRQLTMAREPLPGQQHSRQRLTGQAVDDLARFEAGLAIEPL